MTRAFVRIALIFVATRAILVLATFVPWPVDRCTEYEVRATDGRVLEVVRPPWKLFKDGAGGESWVYLHPPAWLDAFARMDAEYYLAIAAMGYAPVPGEATPPQRAGFFPGYPMAVHVLARVFNAAQGRAGAALRDFPATALASAFVASNLALLLAAFALFRLAHLFLDAPTAEWAAVWLLASPVSFFGSAYLAESLFLWLSISSLLCALKRRMAWAALFGAAAAVTRPVGALLVIPLLMVSMGARAEGRRVVRDGVLLLAVPAGAIAVALWHARALGDPWAYFEIQRGYGHGGFPDIAGVADLFRFGAKDALACIRDGVQIAAMVVGAFCCAALLRGGARKVPRPLAAWAIVSIAFALLSGHLLSMPRYLFGTFPIFVGAAILVPSGRRAQVLAAGSVALQVAGFVVFMLAWPILI